MATVVAEISRELVVRDHEVLVAARTDGGPVHDVGAQFYGLGSIPWPQDLRSRIRWKAEVAVSRAFGWHWPAYASYLVGVRRLLDRLGPLDAVVVHNDPFTGAYLKSWLPASTRVVLWLHNDVTLPRRWPTTCRPDHVLAVSSFLARAVAGGLGLAPAEIRVAHNGVDARLFRPGPDRPGPAHALKVICVGRLDRSKGADVALDAVTALRAEGRAVELTVVGSPWFHAGAGGQLDGCATEFVARLAAGGHTHLPHVPHEAVVDLYRRHDVACVLSRWDDPFPLVVLEAMASGCAVIGTTRGGIPEAAGDAGVLVPDDDASAVAGVLRRLLETPGLLGELQRRGRSHAETMTWAAPADLLLEVLGGGRRLTGRPSTLQKARGSDRARRGGDPRQPGRLG